MSEHGSDSEDDGFGDFAEAAPPSTVAPPATPPDATPTDASAKAQQPASEERLSVSAALQRFRQIERRSKEQRELTEQQLALLEQQRLSALSLRASNSGSLAAAMAHVQAVCSPQPHDALTQRPNAQPQG